MTDRLKLVTWNINSVRLRADLIERFRTDLEAPGVPFIIGQLGQFEGKPWTREYNVDPQSDFSEDCLYLNVWAPRFDQDAVPTGAGRLPVMGFQTEQIRSIPIMPMDDLVTHYYFRFDALDRPGVLAAISGILGKHEISLKSVHQKGRKTNGSVPVVMLTHFAREADVIQALNEIRALDVIAGRPMLIRIEDENGQEA